jgi:hypothetical protein
MPDLHPDPFPACCSPAGQHHFHDFADPLGLTDCCPVRCVGIESSLRLRCWPGTRRLVYQEMDSSRPVWPATRER